MPIRESDYSKSVSTYIIKEKHQNTDKGEVFERDITTIGGRNFFDKNQKPVFRSGNFIITTSNEETTPMPPKDVVWDTPPDGDGELWTWEDVEDVNEETDSSISLELKPDVYDLRTFAYYGSCVELIRGSLNHIISTFPGEVYATEQKLQYLKDNTEYAILGETGYQNLVENPFLLNLHTKYVDQYFIDQEPLKYFFVDEFYKKAYDFIDSSGKECDIEKVEYHYFQYGKPTKNEPCQPYIEKNENGDDVGASFFDFDEDESEICNCVPPYSIMGILTIEPKTGNSVTIHVWKLEGEDYAYLTNSTGWHIRPKSNYYI